MAEVFIRNFGNLQVMQRVFTNVISLIVFTFFVMEAMILYILPTIFLFTTIRVISVSQGIQSDRTTIHPHPLIFFCNVSHTRVYLFDALLSSSRKRNSSKSSIETSSASSFIQLELASRNVTSSVLNIL